MSEFLINRRFKTGIFLLITVMLSVSGALFSQDSGNHGYSFGGPDNDLGYSICLTPDSNYAIAGTTRSKGNGSNDLYFLIISKSGELLQKKTYGWEHPDYFRKILPIEGGYALIGDMWYDVPRRRDIFMMFTNENGDSISGKFYGTNKRDNGFDIIQPDSNSFFILGHSRKENPKGDILLIKTDKQGNELWEKSFWGENNDYAFQIIRSPDNSGFVFAGSKNGFFDDLYTEYKTHDADFLYIKIDNNGNQLWKRSTGGNDHDMAYSVCAANDNGYYILGASQSYGSGSFDMLLIKTDSDGNKLWQKSYGGESFEYGKSLAVTDDGNIYLMGSSDTGGKNGNIDVDVFVVKTDLSGNEIWSETIGGSKNDFGESLVVTGKGGCAITGSTESFGEGGKDVYFLKLASDGTVQQIRVFSSTGNDKKLTCYPNPTNDYTIFQIKESGENFNFKLFDMKGKKVREISVNNSKFKVERATLPSGTYIYHIFSNDNNVIFSGKLIIR